MIIFSVSLAYAFDEQPAIIARSTSIFFALCAAIFLPAFLGGLFWKGATQTGAKISMIVGFLVSSFWLLFVHFKEAKELGLAKAIFGSHSLLSGKIIFVDALVIALPLSAIAFIIVSKMTQKMDEKHLEKCFND
jgi:SSS family solute:Na+ symporter